MKTTEQKSELRKNVQFQSAKLWQRMLTNFAGPMNNFILAIVLFIILAFMQGGVQVTNTNRVGEIMPNGAAAEAGLKENDEVVSVDGKEIHSWNDRQQSLRKIQVKH